MGGHPDPEHVYGLISDKLIDLKHYFDSLSEDDIRNPDKMMEIVEQITLVKNWAFRVQGANGIKLIKRGGYEWKI